MTLARLAAALIAAALPVLAPQQTPPSAPGQQPRATFRAVADIVPVHVSVRTDRSFVRNLTASDFELYDNGVRQDIRAVAADSLAVDVTLVVDTSGSVVRSIGRFKSDVRDIVRQLRPDEQVRLITFDSELREIFPMKTCAIMPSCCCSTWRATWSKRRTAMPSTRSRAAISRGMHQS